MIRSDRPRAGKAFGRETMTSTRAYQRPRTIEEVVRAVSSNGATLLAGGTDLLPRWTRELLPRPDAVVDLKSIEELKGIKPLGDEICVGACTLMSELEADPVIKASAPVLAEAAGRIACPQIRNRATIGGNLCNASPAADTAVPLILLDAALDLVAGGPGATCTRQVSINDFFQGPGTTVLRPGEVLTRIRFKPIPAGWFSAWDKFGTRPAMEIAVASVGVVLALEQGEVTHARVAYGSVAPVPRRGRGAELELLGRRLTDEVIEACTAAAREEITPISDVRAGAAYRREIVGVMLRRMLEDARG